jgi:hypothetical protein
MTYSLRVLEGKPELESALESTASALCVPVSPELRADVENHLGEGQLFYRIFSGDEEVGFAIFKLLPGDLLYLTGIMLRQEHQHRGIAGQVIEAARKKTGAPKLMLRTQSARMWAVGHKLCSMWFPAMMHGDPPTALHLLRVSDVFPLQEGCYGGPLYGEKPLHPNPDIQSWWDSFCNYERGDAVMCLGRF